ncbi:protein unc-13 protein [Trifolium repens]|nr:protein unc-13 protein [Trifolium repens]
MNAFFPSTNNMTQGKLNEQNSKTPVQKDHLMEAVKTSMQLLIESASSLMQVLNQLCDVIFESLRDRVVTGLLQASLDGLLRVLLDGGPSQLFLPSDAKLMEEDLEVLKEFFISGGDGLPWGVLQNQVTRVR